MVMNINGLDYKITDALDKPVTIPDCYGASTNKTGGGHGERKGYRAPKDRMREFFGGENFTVKCFIKKEDLLSYLDLMEDEYLHPSLNYRGKDKLPKLLETR